MPSYVYRCEVHGLQELVLPMSAPRAGYFCMECDLPLKRDYAAEAVGFTGVVEMRRVREAGGSSAVRDLFLPTTKDMEGPDDPDGSKGIRQWNEEHDPAPTNKRPFRPTAPRRSF